MAVLATVSADGQPDATPVWFLYEDGVFYVSVEAKSRKRRNIDANPNVCLVVDERTLPYRYVMAKGRATVLPGSSDHRLRIADRYLGMGMGQDYIKRRPTERTVLLRIEPTRVVDLALDPRISRAPAQ